MAGNELIKSTKSPSQGPISGSSSVHSADVEEQERYAACYDRIYPLLREGQFDFAAVAKQAEIKERKVREILLFRLTPGDMMQLIGRKEGICYLCATRLRGIHNKEPLCLLCLKNITAAVEKVYSSEPPTSPLAAPISTELISNTDEDMVPRSQYEAVLQEVNRYRDKYGPLEMPSEAPSPMLQEDAAALCAASPSESQESEDPLLNVLGISDSEEPEEPNPLQHTDASSKPIRHYGFQRVRSRH